MNLARRQMMAGLAAAPLSAPALRAASPPCSADDQTLRPAQDWPDLARYAAANRAMIAAAIRADIVFMGDSITQGWPDKRPGFFSSGRLCRGIGGQTTPQMLLRMMADVVALNPRIVHIMGGTNDIAGNTGPITPRQTLDNLAAMSLLAKARGIRVLLGSIPPAACFPWRSGLETAHTIAALNAGLRHLARELRVTFVDYTPALTDGAGGIGPGLADDGVHPNSKGYEAMEAVLAPWLPPARRGR